MVQSFSAPRRQKFLGLRIVQLAILTDVLSVLQEPHQRSQAVGRVSYAASDWEVQLVLCSIFASTLERGHFLAPSVGKGFLRGGTFQLTWEFIVETSLSSAQSVPRHLLEKVGSPNIWGFILDTDRLSAASVPKHLLKTKIWEPPHDYPHWRKAAQVLRLWKSLCRLGSL